MIARFTRTVWDPTLERHIASVRLVLAVFGLFVVWVDPTQPSKHVAVAYIAFSVYGVYSAAALWLVRGRPRPWLVLATQLIDLVWIPPILLFTEAGNTPFFPFFIVIMLTAGIRWGLWASWAVTAYSVVVYAGLLFIEPPTPLDLNNDLMQLAYFLIVGILGGHLAEYRRRRESELRSLRATAERISTKYRASEAMEVIVDAARTHGTAATVLGILRDPEHGGIVMIRNVGHTKRLTAEEAAPFLSAIAAYRGADTSNGVLLTHRDDRILRFVEADRGRVFPVRVGDDLVGAVFLFFRAGRDREEGPDAMPTLLLRHVMPQLETLYALEQAPQARMLQERRRIARDLHDSFIQVLAAVGLRLDVLSAALPDTPAALERQQRELAQLREVMGREQLRVRGYLAEMREAVAPLGSLRDVIQHGVQVFEARTQLPVDVTVTAEVATLPGEIRRELAPLLREALTNVEKHAHASRVTVAAAIEADDLVITVADDGVGIDAVVAIVHGEGRPASGQGLSSMRERAQLLGGTLRVETLHPHGTALTVSIPMRALG